MRARRRRPADDSGMTLTELLVSMLIFSLLMAITTAVMINLMYMSKDSLGRVTAVENARLGLSQIDRQVRSGNVILDPGLETFGQSGVAPYFSMRIFTQEGGTPKCAQWRVYDDDGDGSGDLEYRTWSPNYPTDPAVTTWSVVARNLVITTVTTPDPDDESTWPPFWKDPSAVVGTSGTSAAQNVRITLQILTPDMREGSKPITISSVVTGRNTVLGYSESNCSIVPTP